MEPDLIEDEKHVLAVSRRMTISEMSLMNTLQAWDSRLPTLFDNRQPSLEYDWDIHPQGIQDTLPKEKRREYDSTAT
jgi:hypothetical protein